jgi:hypothetical protein
LRRGASQERALWIPGGIHPLVDFGVERHTLVTGEITQIFHQSLTAVTQVAAARAHLFKVRAQLLRRLSESTCPIQGESSDSLPTQLRGGQGASIAWFLVKFRRRNHLGRIIQPVRVRQLERIHLGFSRDHQIRSREIFPTHSEEPRALSLRPL